MMSYSTAPSPDEIKKMVIIASAFETTLSSDLPCLYVCFASMNTILESKFCFSDNWPKYINTLVSYCLSY